MYAFIVTGSSMGLLAFIFCLFKTELWLLIYVRILFLLNILRTNGRILTIIYITLLTRSTFGFERCYFFANL